MAHLTNKIIQILHKCNKDDYKGKFLNLNESLEKVKSHAGKLLTDTLNNYVGCVEYASLNKMLATCNLKVSNHWLHLNNKDRDVFYISQY